MRVFLALFKESPCSSGLSHTGEGFVLSSERLSRKVLYRDRLIELFPDARFGWSEENPIQRNKAFEREEFKKTNSLSGGSLSIDAVKERPG